MAEEEDFMYCMHCDAPMREDDDTVDAQNGDVCCSDNCAHEIDFDNSRD